MTRTVHDIEVALYADVDHAVDTDAMVARIVPAARRRRRRRLVGAGVGTAVSLAVAVAVPSLVGEPLTTLDENRSDRTFTGDCVIEELAFPPQIMSPHGTVEQVQVTAMDSTGRFIIAQGTIQREDPVALASVAIVWDAGTPSVLQYANFSLHASAVNAAGTVVGTMWPDDVSETSAWIYSSGVLTLLPTPRGYDATSASGINDRGEVAGSARAAGGIEDAVVWAADDAHTPRLLAPRGASADAIGADGTVVGRVIGSGRPYVWAPDGTGRFLDLPAGALNVLATEIRGDWVTGTATTAPFDPNAPTPTIGVLWNVRTGDLTSVIEQLGYPLLPVNAHGDLLVQDGPASVLVRDGVSYPLPTLPNETWRKRSAPAPVAEAVALSDDATVIAGTHTSYEWDHPASAVVWHC